MSTSELPSALPRVRAASVDTSADRVSWALVLLTIVCAPIHLVFVADPGYDSWRYSPYLALVDLVLIALIALRFVPATRTLLARGTGDRAIGIPRSLGALFVVLSAAFAIHPSGIGATTLMRLAGVIVLAELVGRADRSQLGAVIGAVVAATTAEAVICVAQKALGHSVGLGFLGEVGVPFNQLGSHLSPTGTIFYPYPLTGLGLMTAAVALAAAVRGIVRTRTALIAAASGAVLVGLSFSVAGALSAAALVGVGVVTLVADRSVARRTLGAGLLVFASAAAVTVATDPGGWWIKGERTSQGVEAAGNGRVGMLREAKVMIERWPITGIGPGNFMAVRHAHPDIEALAEIDQPVHMVPLLIVVEGGVLAALALAAVAVAAVRGLRRSGGLGAMVAVSFSGFLLFDHYLWLFGIGTMTLGVWFGVLTALARLGRTPDDGLMG